MKLQELTKQYDEEINMKTSYKKNKSGTEDTKVGE